MAGTLGEQARGLFAPIFSEADGAPGPAGGPDLARLKTYRYLRIGMVVVVLALAASVALERRLAGCYQESISAYYFTPARAVFIGALCAIGVSLVVIKGSTAFEDGCLNIAGMLAPVVAFVPTTDVGACWSVAPGPAPLLDDGSVAPWVAANIDNNIGALLIAGFIALILGAVIATIDQRDPLAVAKVGELGTRVGLTATFVGLVIATALFWWWDAFDTQAHGIAAVAMFGFLALAALGNGVARLRADRSSGYGRAYLVVGVAMVVAALALQLPSDWDHRVLVLEIVEIVLFVAFWLVQSKERWTTTI